MEIKKSKKLLKALIATSFVGVVATPIMLTSCSKKNKGSFADELIAKGLKFTEKVENQKGKEPKEVKFSDFDGNKTKIIECIVNDDGENENNKVIKSFIISVELPFEKGAQDAPELSVNNNSVGVENNKESYVNIDEGQVDENNKKIVKYTVTVDDKDNIVKKSKKNAKSTNDVKENDIVKLDPTMNYATITFKFTDIKNKDKKPAEFAYKITFKEKEDKKGGASK